jgi:phosphatidylglycerophosphate synthase
MFDVALRKWIDPALNSAASRIARTGISANALTIIGAGAAVIIGSTIANGAFVTAIILITINRLLDGLDGAVARVNGQTAFGGYLDSLADYIFYLAVPIGFAFYNADNQLPALLLTASFTLTAVSFLAFAAIASQNPDIRNDHGPKAFLYTTGLMEGGETIAFFILMAIWPAYFAGIASLFTALCLITIVQRLWMAYHQLR